MKIRIFPHYLLLLAANVILMGGLAYGQPVASFGVSDSAGCQGLVVNFSDSSTGTVTGWQWDFGNGNTSTVQNPSAIYGTPGSYTITLIVDDGSNFDTLVKANCIVIHDNPDGGFSGTNISGCVPLTVGFQDTTMSGSIGISNWVWDFGDGNSDTVANPTYTYSNPGVYTVSLLVTDSNGCTGSAFTNNYVTASNNPTVAFTLDTSFACDSPITASFSNTSSGVMPLSWSWDFGDGQTSTSQNPVHNYSTLGTFDVQLIVTDAYGCTDSLTQSSAMNIGSPVAAWNGSDTLICQGQGITFSDVSTNGAVSRIFDMGDGNTNTSGSFVHTYAATGFFDVEMIASNAFGCADTLLRTSFVEVLPVPTADFTTIDTASCTAPFNVQFTDASTGAIAWDWDFGDGNTSTQQSPLHTYTGFGLYSVKLVVMNVDSCYDSITYNNLIDVAAPVANFTASLGGSTCLPRTVPFNDISTSADTIVGWLWDFGDGNTSTQQNPTHIFTTTGNFTVQLIITTSGGCTDTFTQGSTIGAQAPPNIEFGPGAFIACIGQPLTFADSSDTTVNAWTWQFGDLNSSGLQNPTHVYTDTGSYTVSLTGCYNGCCPTEVKTGYVTIVGPIAGFSMDSTIGCSPPHTVNFTDTSYMPDTWAWDFGDLNVDSTQNPSHVYGSIGVYPVSLIVTDTISMCADTAYDTVRVSTIAANFGADTLFGCAPLPITFNDSMGSGQAWLWDFGDGNTSTAATPTHVYNIPGVYPVSLVMTDTMGCVDTVLRNNLVNIQGPIAMFFSDTVGGCPGVQFQFDDSSTSAVGINSWKWYFGDGDSSTVQKPKHTYAAVGTYDVTLIVSDATGCFDTVTTASYINVSNPAVGFTINDTLVCPGTSVTFTDTTQGVGLQHFWDFGDSNTSTQPNPTHSYGNSGIYDVKLVIVDGNACSDSTTHTAAVNVQLPTANFGAVANTASCPPFLVDFRDSSSSDVVSWFWDFGDSTSSTGPNPNHIYNVSDSFTVTLIVTTADGCSDTIVKSNFVIIDGPSGSFVHSPDTVCIPGDVTFIATTQNTAINTWDFGDGNVASGAPDSIVHTYTTVGLFNPILQLDDGLGCIVTLTASGPVLVDSHPTAAFTVDTQLVCNAQGIQFTDQSTSPRPFTSWQWDFGDGNTSTSQNPGHTYAGPGVYDVQLVVTHELGCVDTLTQTQYIAVGDPPVAGFTQSTAIACPGFATIFSDTSVYSNPADTWSWTFGDGGSDTVNNPNHTYNTPGNYTIELIVQDTLGCLDTTSNTIQILVPPVVDVIISDSTPCVDEPITITDNSTGSIAAWAWDFGDANIDSIQNPTHAYADTGTYFVQLTITDSAGCRDTLTPFEDVVVYNTVASFSMDNSNGCDPLTVIFRDSSSSDTSLVNWEWDFGDANTAIGSDSVSHTYAGPGTYTITLVTTNGLGCTDTVVDSIAITIQGFFQPSIYTATVLDDISDSISFRRYPYADFGYYRIHREDPVLSNNFLPIDSIYVQDDTTYYDVGIFANQTHHGYKVQVVDTCGNALPLNMIPPHRTINLLATPGADQVTLNWNSYQGWNSAAAYEVYRADGYNKTNYQLLSVLPGTDSSFLDTMAFCTLTYSYRIRAIDTSALQLESWSDTAQAVPSHPPLTVPPDMIRATVESNSVIYLEWQNPNIRRPSDNILYRSTDGNNWNAIDTLSYLVTNYTDVNVDVNTQNYFYQLQTTDSCSAITPPSNLGRNILLNVDPAMGDATLFWTPYHDWAGGVMEYQIEVSEAGTNIWTMIGSVPGNDLQASDQSTIYTGNMYCYRVTAIENGGNQAISLSNEACVVPDVWVPNTITPNADGFNDFLIIPAIEHYPENEIVIFNRWGNEVYRANNYANDWDGTNSKTGAQVPDGNYYYVLKANNNLEEFSGYVMVHR